MEGNKRSPVSETMEAQRALLVDGDFCRQHLVDDGCNADDCCKKYELLHALMVPLQMTVMWFAVSGSLICPPVPFRP